MCRDTPPSAHSRKRECPNAPSTSKSTFCAMAALSNAFGNKTLTPLAVGKRLSF